MKLSRRGAAADAEPTTDDTGADDAAEASSVELTKGRPTPKRRDAQGRRGPVTAPKTRKEAYARQKQLTREQRVAEKSGRATGTTTKRSAAEQRAALRRGDPDALPRRDRGRTRKLARDYVDSHRMLSNYLLWLFPLFFLSTIVPDVSIVVIVVLAALLLEWYLVGRRLRALAMQRFGEADGGNFSIGFYMGQRAYLPRRWRLPAPQVQRGDEI